MSLAISRILVPTDFSPCAKGALDLALYLARRHGADVTLLNVTELTLDYAFYPAIYSPDPKTVSQQVDLASRRALDEALADLDVQDVDGVTVSTESVRGLDTAETVSDYVAFHEVDLVVIGTNGRRGLSRLTLGSVAETVVRKAPCPVLTVHQDQVSDPRLLRGRVLVPVDFSDYAQQAVRTGIDLVRASGGELVLLHAVGRDKFPLAYHNNPQTYIDHHARELSKAREQLQRIAQELVHGRVPVRLRVATGGAARTITDYVQSHGISLVCLSTHGRTGIHRFFAGSVAEKVVRRCTCPVLTVKSFSRALAFHSTDHAA